MQDNKDNLKDEKEENNKNNLRKEAKEEKKEKEENQKEDLKVEKNSGENDNEKENKKNKENKDNIDEPNIDYNELENRKKELKEKLRSKMQFQKDDKKNSNEFKNKFNFKTILLLIFVVMFILTIPTIMNNHKSTQVKTVSYSEFVTMVKDNKFDKIHEKDDYVIGDISKTVEQKGEKVITQQSFKARMISNRLSQDAHLMSVIEKSKIPITSIEPEKMSLLLRLLISWSPMLILIALMVFMMNKMKGGGSGGSNVFNIGKSKAKDNVENLSKIKFNDVAGIEEAKQELIEVVDFLKEPEKYQNIGATIPKGVLLLGAPGTGKTLLAKAVAGEAGVPFFSISGSEFVEMFVGVGASRVRDLFTKARKSAPCIVFIDEIDAVGRKRGSGQGGGNDEREQTLNQLLVEMDGFGTDETIIIIAATNRPEVLDKALMRPGRFDRQVVVDRPDIKGREAILKVHIKDKKLSDDVDLHTLAKKTPGFVGADLANLLNEAAILAAREKRLVVTMEDLEEASEKVSIGPARKSRVTVQKEKNIIAYHEVGHAMIQSHFKEYLHPVHKVTVVPRGSAALGYTMSLPTEDRYLKGKKEFLAEIRGLLGGRAAEEIVFGDITTGASNDIERATGIAHAMVTKFGMSDKFGPILLDATKEGDMFPNKIYGEETAKAIDDEIKLMIDKAYSESKKILKMKYKLLDKIAKILLERETISGVELNTLIDGGELKPIEPIIKKKEEKEKEYETNSETEIEESEVKAKE